jgi:hypothetical protein
MLNQMVLLGRLKKIEGNKITLESTCQERNKKGVFETYTNEFELNGEILENTIKYVLKGDLIGIRAIYVNNKVIVNRITFLSSKKALQDKKGE